MNSTNFSWSCVLYLHDWNREVRVRVLLLSEAGHEAERAAEEDRGAAGEAGVPHVGHLVQYSTVQYSTVQHM